VRNLIGLLPTALLCSACFALGRGDGLRTTRPTQQELEALPQLALYQKKWPSVRCDVQKFSAGHAEIGCTLASPQDVLWGTEICEETETRLAETLGTIKSLRLYVNAQEVPTSAILIGRETKKHGSRCQYWAVKQSGWSSGSTVVLDTAAEIEDERSCGKCTAHEITTVVVK
jgi:hypothetical protein